MISVWVITGTPGPFFPNGGEERREERRGGVLEQRRSDEGGRKGGRNSLKSQGEVRVATDRQIAAEKDRLGKKFVLLNWERSRG